MDVMVVRKDEFCLMYDMRYMYSAYVMKCNTVEES